MESRFRVIYYLSIDLLYVFFQAVCIAKFCLIFVLLFLPVSVQARDDFVTRAEGYVLIWESISRPAFFTKSSYKDVPEGSYGFTEISYGKRRGILSKDTDTFRPQEPLLLKDALLWLYRTRNIRELPDMQESDLPSMVGDYPIVEMNRSLDGRVRRNDLFAMMTKLDGMLRTEVHTASYYADYFHGRTTAFGEIFDMHDITAAHRSLPHNTLVRVTNIENKKSIIVRINDRGPYVEGRNMDLSLGAFGKIAHHGEGLLRATFERLGDKDLIDRCEQRQKRYQKRITRDIHFFRGVPHTFSLGEQLVLQSRRPFVIQGITFPDQQYLRVQDFVLPEEKYRFTPDMPGLYEFHVGDTLGSSRVLRMNVSQCVLPEEG